MNRRKLDAEGVRFGGSHRMPFRGFLPFFLVFGLALGTVLGCVAHRGTIGANLGRQADGRVFIREVPPKLGAAKAGLQPGDEITLINGRDVRTFDEKSLHSLLSGEVGETVKLTVLRGEEVLHVTVERTPAPLLVPAPK